MVINVDEVEKTIYKRDLIDVDPDMRQMLDELMDHYTTDEGHLIRALLRERKRRISRLHKLEGPDYSAPQKERTLRIEPGRVTI